MENIGQIIRSKKTGKSRYTPISNEILQSKILTPEEKSILVHLLSLPEDWVVYKTEIWKNMNIGRDKFNKHWKGLVEKGYILSVKIIKENGQFAGYNHIVYEEPSVPGNQLTENQVTEIQGTGIQGTGIQGTEIQGVNKVIIEQSNKEEKNNIQKNNLKSNNEKKNNNLKSNNMKINKEKIEDISINNNTLDNMENQIEYNDPPLPTIEELERNNYNLGNSIPLDKIEGMKDFILLFNKSENKPKAEELINNPIYQSCDIIEKVTCYLAPKPN